MNFAKFKIGNIATCKIHKYLYNLKKKNLEKDIKRNTLKIFTTHGASKMNSMHQTKLSFCNQH